MSAWRIGAGAQRPAAVPQTEARRVCGYPIAARDERIFCGAEQAWSQGKWGDQQACEA
jgi:hypothetical protein